MLLLVPPVHARPVFSLKAIEEGAYVKISFERTEGIESSVEDICCIEKKGYWRGVKTNYCSFEIVG